MFCREAALCSHTDHVGPRVRHGTLFTCGHIDHVGLCVLQAAIGPGVNDVNVDVNSVNVMAAGEGFCDLAVFHGKPRAGTVVVQVTLMSIWPQHV